MKNDLGEMQEETNGSQSIQLPLRPTPNSFKCEVF